MPLYWVRNKKNQVAAEISEKGMSIHDDALSWQLQKLKDEGGAPFAPTDAPADRTRNLDALMKFLEENGYTLEPRDT
jgi:hypothetical protein